LASSSGTSRGEPRADFPNREDAGGAGPELAYLTEAANVHGIDSHALTVTRVQAKTPGGSISALRYSVEGASPTTAIALLHGGGQNAHTWDLTVAALGLPVTALDLPGHGSSHWLEDHDYSPRRLAASVTRALEILCPDMEVLVGMSLGGMVAISAAPSFPQLREVVLVDVSPGSVLSHGSSIQEIRRLPAASFETLVERMAAASPRRAHAGLRHAVWHSTRPAEGGRVWRTDPDMQVGSFADLWPELTSLAPVVTEVLAEYGSFVPAEDRIWLADLLGDRASLVEGATHSIQNTRPQELASILRRIVGQ